MVSHAARHCFKFIIANNNPPLGPREKSGQNFYIFYINIHLKTNIHLYSATDMGIMNAKYNLLMLAIQSKFIHAILSVNVAKLSRLLHCVKSMY